MQESKVYKEMYSEGNLPKIAIHDTERPTAEGMFALSLIEKWGMVQGSPEGEDSAGRAKMNQMPIAETIDRAFEMSELAFKRMRKDGLMNTLPTYAEMEVILQKEKQERIEQAKKEAVADKTEA